MDNLPSKDQPDKANSPTASPPQVPDFRRQKSRYEKDPDEGPFDFDPDGLEKLSDEELLHDLQTQPAMGWWLSREAERRYAVRRAAAKLLRVKPEGGTSTSRITEAVMFLKGFLAGGASRPAQSVEQAAQAAGIAKSTLDRAKEGLAIKPRRVGKEWVWSLTPQEPNSLKSP